MTMFESHVRKDYSINRGDAVEIEGGFLFGSGYEDAGSWHLASAGHRTNSANTFDAVLSERQPQSGKLQAVQNIPSKHIRPQNDARRLSIEFLKPGMVLEHRLPESIFCWWVGVVLKRQKDHVLIVYPATASSKSVKADSNHEFRLARHWDLLQAHWSSILDSPLLEGAQSCLESHLQQRPKKRRRKANPPRAAPAVFDPQCIESITHCEQAQLMYDGSKGKHSHSSANSNVNLAVDCCTMDEMDGDTQSASTQQEDGGATHVITGACDDTGTVEEVSCDLADTESDTCATQ